MARIDVGDSGKRNTMAAAVLGHPLVGNWVEERARGGEGLVRASGEGGAVEENHVGAIVVGSARSEARYRLRWSGKPKRRAGIECAGIAVGGGVQKTPTIISLSASRIETIIVT